MFLIIFKQNLFLPKQDNLLLVQRDVTLVASKVNQKHVVNMVYNLAVKTFLFIMSSREVSG